MTVAVLRGHSYGIHDVVTPQNLNELVSLATVTGLASTDFGGILTISTLSLPSSPGIGAISAQYEPFKASGAASASDLRYVMQGVHGPVAVWSPYCLETRRFLFKADTAFLAPGSPLNLRRTGNPSVTLETTIGYTGGFPQKDCLGACHGTGASGSYLRLSVSGFEDSNVVDGGGTDVRHFFYQLNAGGTGLNQHSPGVTNTDGVVAISMDGSLSGSAIIPSWLFGAPVMRS